MSQVFVVHCDPNSGRFPYSTDPDDAVTSAKALYLRSRCISEACCARALNSHNA